MCETFVPYLCFVGPPFKLAKWFPFESYLGKNISFSFDGEFLFAFEAKETFFRVMNNFVSIVHNTGYRDEVSSVSWHI